MPTSKLQQETAYRCLLCSAPKVCLGLKFSPLRVVAAALCGTLAWLTYRNATYTVVELGRYANFPAAEMGQHGAHTNGASKAPLGWLQDACTSEEIIQFFPRRSQQLRVSPSRWMRPRYANARMLLASYSRCSLSYAQRLMKVARLRLSMPKINSLDSKYGQETLGSTLKVMLLLIIAYGTVRKQEH
jgi:hypothetical protein